MIDPFGGIKGKELTNTSGFFVDKEEAIKEVNVSRKISFLIFLFSSISI